MTTIAILGSSGYTAYELIRILLRHPHAEITALTTRQEVAQPIAAVHPGLTGQIDLPCENLSPEEIAERAEFVFCALPHGASMSVIPELLQRGCRVIDLSADYRLKDPDVYREWYDLDHADSGRLKSTPYGLPEVSRDGIADAQLVANPGCYTSTSILGLAPLIQHARIDPAGIVIDAKSGVSGAGRSPKLATLYSECTESISAYSVSKHRHTPEIEQVLSEIGDTQVRVTFTPHLVPMRQGLLCTMYPRLREPAELDELFQLYRDTYHDCPFIRIVEHSPQTRDVRGTNFCDISLALNRDQLVVLSATDNLIKGASGVAVQNFNLMAGYPETTALWP